MVIGPTNANGVPAEAPMDLARRVADAVLREGYLLYPYRASARKNRLRWQFGVLVPPGYTATGEPSASVTECLLEATAEAQVRVRLRFLHLGTRTIERTEGGRFHPVPELTVAGRRYLTFEEAAERETEVVLRVADLLDTERTILVGVPGEWSAEPIEDPGGETYGRVVVEHLSLRAALRVRAERLPGPYGLTRLRVRVANTHGWSDGGAPREHALRRSLLATHLLVGVTGGAFVSLLDPPEWAQAAAADCRNQHTWPVLVGDPDRRDVLLSSPIILYDHPRIAPESPGELFDSTEVDELLSLRTAALTDAEKEEARATDPRAAEIIERTGGLPPETMERLHGAIRRPPEAPWWDPGADRGVSPETDAVTIAGARIAKGSRVRLRPGRHRADVHDMFLAGRAAVVEAVFLDVDGARHLAVTLEDDPGADLARAQGRFHYFAPDEVEPIGPDEPHGAGGGS